MTPQAVSRIEEVDPSKITRAWRAFMAYRGLSLQVFESQAMVYEGLSDFDQSLIPDVPVRLSHSAEAIEHNADIMERVSTLAGVDTQAETNLFSQKRLEEAASDFPDVVECLLAVAREWSTFGESDRIRTYDPIIQAIEETVQDALSTGVVDSRSSFKVLVPGASLGRLSWELANLGISVQGAERSYIFLFMCNFIVNGSAEPKNSLHLYPYAHHGSALSPANDQLKEVDFPDVDLLSSERGELSMVAGEFLDLYNEENVWNSVVTCFAIESSHSIVSYVRRIAKILKIGGVWVNHGCLGFKHDDSMTEPCVEITMEELDLIIIRCGLQIIRKDSLNCRPPYVVDGMTSEEHESSFIVAVRR